MSLPPPVRTLPAFFLPEAAALVRRLRREQRPGDAAALEMAGGGKVARELPWMRALEIVRDAFPAVPEPERTAAALLHWLGPDAPHPAAGAEMVQDFLHATQGLPPEDAGWAALAYGCGWRRSVERADDWSGIWPEAEAELARVTSRLLLRVLRLLQGCVPAFHTLIHVSRGHVDRPRIYWLSTLAVQILTGARPLLPGGHCRWHAALRAWPPQKTSLTGFLLEALAGHALPQRRKKKPGAPPVIKAWAARRSLVLEVLRIEHAAPDDPAAAPPPRLLYSEQTAVRECTPCGRTAPRPMLAPEDAAACCARCGARGFRIRTQKRLFLPECSEQRPYRLLTGSRPAEYAPESEAARHRDRAWSQRPSLLWVHTGTPQSAAEKTAHLPAALPWDDDDPLDADPLYSD